MSDVTSSDPDAFFASLQTARLASKELKPMGAAGLTQAALVWRHWLAFCTVHGVAWDAARSVDIARFCQSIGPRSSLKKTSPVTRRRYWRVLGDLYAHALVVGLVQAHTREALWNAIGELLDKFPPGEWERYIRQSGYFQSG